jgi:hypothetical protein
MTMIAVTATMSTRRETVIFTFSLLPTRFLLFLVKGGHKVLILQCCNTESATEQNRKLDLQFILDSRDLHDNLQTQLCLRQVVSHG